MGFSQKRREWESQRELLNNIRAKRAEEAKRAGMSTGANKKNREQASSGFKFTGR